MNKHTKTALFVAPFLLVGGYILSDMYLESQAHKNKVIELSQSGVCDVFRKSCILESGELKLNVYQEQNETVINSTFQLDNITLFVVPSEASKSPVIYELKMDSNPFYWRAETNLNELLDEVGKDQGTTLRVIAQIKGGHYISEFYAQRY